MTDMCTMKQKADDVAREFLGHALRRVEEFDVAVGRNALLDLLHSSDEPNFIAKTCDHALVGAQSRKVLRAMEPHLIALAGRVYVESRA